MKLNGLSAFMSIRETTTTAVNNNNKNEFIFSVDRLPKLSKTDFN